jgi:hypothetical protein
VRFGDVDGFAPEIRTGNPTNAAKGSARAFNSGIDRELGEEEGYVIGE